MSKRALWVATFAISILAFPGPAAASWPYTDVPFCRPTPVHNYMKPVERLPAVHHSPTDERPGFKRKGVFIHGGTDELLPGGGQVGFGIAYNGNPAVHLNWLVTAKLTAIDRRGRVLRVVAGKQEAIRTPDPESLDDFHFKVSGEPGLYRTTLTIRKLSGELLGRYGQYTRVVEPSSGVRLRLDGTAFHAGEIVYARVENLGTEQVAYGVPYAIEAFDGSSWSTAPESPKGPWILPLLYSAPGYSGTCSGFLIPAEMPAGRYRFVKKLDVVQTRRGGEEKPEILTADFEIVP